MVEVAVEVQISRIRDQTMEVTVGGSANGGISGAWFGNLRCQYDWKSSACNVFSWCRACCDDAQSGNKREELLDREVCTYSCIQYWLISACMFHAVQTWAGQVVHPDVRIQVQRIPMHVLMHPSHS